MFFNLKHFFAILAVVGTTFSSSGTTNFNRNDESSKVSVTRINSSRVRKDAYFSNVQGKPLYQKLAYVSRNYSYVSHANRIYNNKKYSIITYATNPNLVYENTIIVGYTTGISSIGCFYSESIDESINASISDSLSTQLENEIEGFGVEASASITYSIGSYMNTSISAGSTITYSIDYSFPTISSRQEAEGIRYSLKEDKYDFSFICVIRAEDSKIDDIYYKVTYNGVSSYRCSVEGV